MNRRHWRSSPFSFTNAWVKCANPQYNNAVNRTTGKCQRCKEKEARRRTK